MAKEKKLTVLIPITDEDVTATYQTIQGLMTQVIPSKDVANNIYKVYAPSQSYVRACYNPTANQYEFRSVVDREFPHIGKPLEIFNFTYDATRMGTAPTISAQGIMWRADKDNSGNDITLENLWNQKCHVVFNGENFYLKQIPTSSKSNEDARYKYDIDFISERVVLEQVYLYDTTGPYTTEKPAGESSRFSFFGDIHELAKRINASLFNSGLTQYKRKQTKIRNTDYDVPFLTNTQWSIFSDFAHLSQQEREHLHESEIIKGVFDSARILEDFFVWVYSDVTTYEEYLAKYIYEMENGVPKLSGYVCEVGKDKNGNGITSEEKLISFEDNTIHEALQLIYDKFELQYFITRETDENGDFTGNTIILIADCEYDFGEDNPFAYGIDNAFLSVEKTNTTEKIVNRITGYGSEENIPWYYPNPTADGWIEPTYKIDGADSYLIVTHEQEKKSDGSLNSGYDKYLKNRIGDVFQFGKRMLSLSESQTVKNFASYETSYDESGAVLCYEFTLEQEMRVVSQGCACSVQDSEVTYTLFRNQEEVVDGDYGFLIDGGVNTMSAGTYNLIISITFNGNAPTVTDSVQYYYYPPLKGRGAWLDTWTWQFLSVNLLPYLHPIIGFLGRLLSPAVFFTGALQDIFGDGFDISLPGFFSTKSNLRPRYGADAKTFGWYDGENRIEISDMIFGEKNTEYYAFWGGDGDKTLGVDDVYRVVFDDKTYVLSFNLQLLDYTPPYNNVISFWTDVVNGAKNGKLTPALVEEVDLDVYDFIKNYISFSIDSYVVDGWYKNGKKVNLADYGILEEELAVSPDVNHSIDFRRIKYLTPQSRLMPEIYRETEGQKRFYVAHNYYLDGGLLEGEADTTIGEKQSGKYVTNPLYKENETDDDDKHYLFENEFIQQKPLEHIEEIEDVKPSITGQQRTLVIDGKDTSYRIDVVEEFAFDNLDNDEVWENNDNGSIAGEYKHPYFFAKLRPLGFNIFDLALQDDMVLSMTTGHCGSCNFKIGVDENTKKNPVQIWEHDVYKKNGSNYEKVYGAGDLRRYTDTSDFYYQIEFEGLSAQYVPVNVTHESLGFRDINSALSTSSKFRRKIYSTEDVLAGEVGSLKQDGVTHFEGDVVTNGKLIPRQQDTTDEYVWIALLKDTDTYGTIMPSAKPNNIDKTETSIRGTFIDPKGHIYTNRRTEITNELTDDDADHFVLTNIRLPFTYLKSAEHELSRKLIATMYDMNFQKFNFSMKFSRIFFAEKESILDKLNENSVLYVEFNGRKYRQYVKHYSYVMKWDEPLPEISIDSNEKLSAVRNSRQQELAERQQQLSSSEVKWKKLMKERETKIIRNTIGKNEDAVIGGNLFSRQGRTTFAELSATGIGNLNSVSNLQTSSIAARERFTDFVQDVNAFNSSAAARLKQIRLTVENRLLPIAKDVNENSESSLQCVPYYYFNTNRDDVKERFWYSADGITQTATTNDDDGVCREDNGMDDIIWDNFSVNY